MPTEPRDLPLPQPADPAAGDPAATTGDPVAAVGESSAAPAEGVSGDQSQPGGGSGRSGRNRLGRNRSRGGDNRDRRGERSRQRSDGKAAEVKPKKDPAAVKAQQLYVSAIDQAYDILYRPDIRRMGEDGTTEEKIPAKDWSFAAVTRKTAEAKLMFDYQAEPPAPTATKKPKGHRKPRRERPYKKIEPVQNLEDHEEALDQLGLLIGERFIAAAERLQTLLSDVSAAAKGFSDDGTVLKAKVGRPGTREDGEPLADRMLRYKTQLEWKRVDAIRDAVDWYGARVSQIEDAMKALSKRTEAQESVEDRIAKVFTDTAFRKQVELVSKGKVWFQSLLNLDIDCPEADQAIIKNVIASQVQRAMRAVAKFEADQKFFLKLDTQDEKTKRTPIDEVKNKVDMVMLGRANPIAADFIQAADQRLIGLSPDQELNFWQSVLDLFDEVEEQPNKDDFKLPDGEIDKTALQAARVKRINNINETLGISTEVGGRRRLLNPDDQAAPEEGLPKGFGQVVERCRRDAILLVELKKALWKTNAILGPNTKKRIFGIMRGHPNQEKKEAIIGPDEKSGFNGLISKKQMEAVRILGQLPKELKGETTEEQQAAFTEQKAAAEAFTALLAGRKVQDLKWRNVADRPLITQIRVKLHELLEIGTMDELDAEALEELLFPEPEEAKGKKPDVVAVPWTDEIFGKRLPAELFVDAAGEATGITAEHVRTALKEYSGRLVKAFRVGDKDPLAGKLNQEVFKQFKLIQPAELTFASLNQFMETIKLFVEACEQCKVRFGTNWVMDFELLLPPNVDSGKQEPDASHIIQLMERIKAGEVPLSALLELGKTAAETVSAERASAFTAIVEAAHLEPNPNEPTRLLVEQMMNGTIDAAVVTEAYPHEEGRDDFTPESIKHFMEQSIEQITTVVGSPDFADALKGTLHLAILDQLFPAEQLNEVVQVTNLIKVEFTKLQQAFGTDWASDLGLTKDGAVNAVMLATAFANIKADDTSSRVLTGFLDVGEAVTIDNLVGRIDADARNQLNTLEIESKDQLYVVLLAVEQEEAIPPAVALKRLGKFLSIADPKQRGEALLKKRGILVTDVGGALQFDDEELLGIIQNASLD